LRIGPYRLTGRVVLAPMAGVTDHPFRQLCRRLGAALAVSEMVTSDTRLWRSAKTRRRLDHGAEAEPRVIQIAGADPAAMALAARLGVDRGAQIVDINMGCPAKKVCRAMAGSALLQDEALVGRILEAVVHAVPVPVTLKIRTGADPQHRNGVRIARIAASEGIQALAVHGRTRACAYRGEAEYQTIRDIKRAVAIPVLANGDIDSAEKAARVLAFTDADAIMIGRAALGRPWIFGAINHYLEHRVTIKQPPLGEVRTIMLTHLEQLYAFYGEYLGVRIARKHIGWYLKDRPGSTEVRRRINSLERARPQLQAVARFMEARMADGGMAA
jgi:tRNA-dihydrouridine synthase B